MMIIFNELLQVKIWFQNRRAKERKILKRQGDQERQRKAIKEAAEAATNYVGMAAGMEGMLSNLHTSNSSMQLPASLATSSHLHQALCKAPNASQLPGVDNTIPPYPTELRHGSVSYMH
jgi:hypothetical protein